VSAPHEFPLASVLSSTTSASRAAAPALFGRFTGTTETRGLARHRPHPNWRDSWILSLACQLLSPHESTSVHTSPPANMPQSLGVLGTRAILAPRPPWLGVGSGGSRCSRTPTAVPPPRFDMTRYYGLFAMSVDDDQLQSAIVSLEALSAKRSATTTPHRAGLRRRRHGLLQVRGRGFEDQGLLCRTSTRRRPGVAVDGPADTRPGSEPSPPGPAQATFSLNGRWVG